MLFIELRDKRKAKALLLRLNDELCFFEKAFKLFKSFFLVKKNNLFVYNVDYKNVTFTPIQATQAF